MAPIPILDEKDPGIPAEALKAMSGLLQSAYRKDSALQPQYGELAYCSTKRDHACRSERLAPTIKRSFRTAERFCHACFRWVAPRPGHRRNRR